MSKNTTPDPSDAEDYLNQLNWRSKHPYRRDAWRYEPKWRYKPIVPVDDSKLTFSSILMIGLIVGAIGCLIYLFIAQWSSYGSFGLIALAIIFAVLFFAVHDAKQKSDKSGERDEDDER